MSLILLASFGSNLSVFHEKIRIKKKHSKIVFSDFFSKIFFPKNTVNPYQKMWKILIFFDLKVKNTYHL